MAQTGNWRRLTKVLLKRREFTPEIAAKSAHHLACALSRALISSPDLWIAMAKAFTVARIRPRARYSLFDKRITGDEIKIEITKVTGQPVANLKAPGAPGFTRLNWDLGP